MSDEKGIRQVKLSYIQNEKVETFRKYSVQKLVIEQLYGARIVLDAEIICKTIQEFMKVDFQEVVTSVKETFRNLENRGIFILELIDCGNKTVCKASKLN